jgi:hypothetical protein
MRKYIYLSNKLFDGTVYQTQIVDWLKLYKENGVNFDLYQLLHPKELRSFKNVIKQKQDIKAEYNQFKGYLLHFPNTKWFYLFNSLLIIFKFAPYLLRGDKIIVFGRALIGNEIRILKYFLKNKIQFIYDARAASAEESKYVALKNQCYNSKKQLLYERIRNLEKITISQSAKTFAVSNILIQYFITNYGFEHSKFFLYPCLSDERKFYFDENLRYKFREILTVGENQKLILYAGGFNSEWHIMGQMLHYFEELNKTSSNFKFIILTKDIDIAENIVKTYKISNDSMILLSVKNHEVINYLNAADFGILFREDTPMNNVASPSKFPEYQLTGLPVLVTEGVGDFTEYVRLNNTGFIVNLKESTSTEHIRTLLNTSFNRMGSSLNAKDIFTKQSLVGKILYEFKSI